MTQAPLTRPSLLVRLRDYQDHDAWAQFLDLYAPVVYGFLRKHGLQDADAADLTQASLYQIATRVQSLVYDPGRGEFRGWLFTLVRNKLRDFRAKPHRLFQGSGDPALHRLLEVQPAPEDQDADVWEREYRRGLLAWAAEQVRPQVQETTWQAFWQSTAQGKPVAEVAQALGLSVAAVYLAKSRVMARLRNLIREVHEED
jgi:RNA polymerase sigma factor (sigma-70 family)